MATAITPMAFYETVMVKGYETLVDSDTKVDVNTGMIAAGSAASADRIPGRRYQHRRPHGADGSHHRRHPLHACRRSCGRRSCARSMDPSRLIHRRMSSKTVTTRKTMYDPAESAKADEDCWTATVRRDPPVEGRRAPTRTIEAPSPVIRKFTPKTVKDDDDF